MADLVMVVWWGVASIVLMGCGVAGVLVMVIVVWCGWCISSGSCSVVWLVYY